MRRKIFFGFQNDLKSPMTSKSWSEIFTIMNSDKVVNLCKQIAELDPSAENYKELKNGIKKRLPAITPHASSFVDGERKNDRALWSGYVCVEYDNLSEEEILGFYTFSRAHEQFVGLGYGADLISRSASGRGVWLLVRVKDGDYQKVDETIQAVHETLCYKIGRSLDFKLDEAKDLARLRFLPSYEYVMLDEIGKTPVFQDNCCIISQFSQLYEWSNSIVLSDEDKREGRRHQTYKKLAIESVKYCQNRDAILLILSDLGLPRSEREQLIDWALKHVKKDPQYTIKKQNSSPQIPLDYEALPYPKDAAPELMNVLVDQLPACWKQTAALALLPVLSTAAGRMSYGSNQKPLAFHVAVYGKAGSGKSQFTCAPAQKIMDILSREDNHARRSIEMLKQGFSLSEACPRSPKVLGFDTSTVQLAKYLQYASQTVMLYTDEISSCVGSDRNQFMQLQPLLRKGYDGIQHIADYKDIDSFRGTIFPRISYLACGTPTTMFKYFNDSATEQGSTRRTILVEHPSYKQEVREVQYTEQQLELIESELNYLQTQKGIVYNANIEYRVEAWKRKKQLEAGDDEVKLLMVNTPADTMRRAAYLAYILFRYDEYKWMECVKFGEWVAEYQLRSYSNRTYTSLKQEEQKQKQYESISTQQHQALFNKQMLEALPNVFTWDDVLKYRIEKKYPHNPKSMVILSRWKKNGDITNLGGGVFEKTKWETEGDV